MANPKKFVVTTTQVVTSVETTLWYVDADSKEEAAEMVRSGENDYDTFLDGDEPIDHEELVIVNIEERE